MKKRIISSVVFLICVLNMQAQNSVIPPSPTACSLGEYANTPVSLFTGTPQISVPLCEVKVPGYPLPVFLSYYAQGIKVERIASNVGLGWALNAGGIITRTVVGFPDDISAYMFKKTYTGFLINNNAEMVQNFNTTAEDTTIDNRLHHFLDNQIDTDPDIFYFNIGGKTGSFV